MYKSFQTERFAKWLHSLKDIKGKVAIARRIVRAESGNFGDTEPVGEAVFEMKVDIGPGYRVYYIIKDDKLIILLCGGINQHSKKILPKPKNLQRILNERKTYSI